MDQRGMAGPSAEPLKLPRKLRRTVERWARSTKLPHRTVQRAKIVALASQGLSNAAIAERLSITEDTARKWRERMRRMPKLTTLRDAFRRGRPARVPLTVRLEVIKLACQRPAKDKTPFREIWTARSLGDRAAEVTGWRLSTSEVRRILHCGGVRPHHVRVWLHSPDPDFARKSREVCTLYRSPPDGARVVCIDEKPGMQALDRVHPVHYGRGASEVRHEFEYVRHGTQTLIAAFDVRTGEVFGQCRRRTAKGLLAFMEAVATRYPTGVVYVVWDNLNIHHGKRWSEFSERHGGRFRFVHTPLHASWVNQVEIWFSILQRRVLKYASFGSREALRRAVLGFIRHWNRFEAHPFRWTFRGTRRSVLARAA
jgi:transposase